MFHFDCTMEDIRIIATEHRVPLVGEELEHAKRYNEGKDLRDHFHLDKHDGTFDVLHVDALKGTMHTINLTGKELAAVIHLGLEGDDAAAYLYNTAQIKRYQELMVNHQHMSFIP